MFSNLRRFLSSGGIFLFVGIFARFAVASQQAYFTLTEDELGKRDLVAANGNPMKGLITNPEFHYDPTIESIDSSMDCYYIPVGNVMLDDPNVVGFDNAFNWTFVEERIDASGRKDRHVVLTFAVHYPGDPLSLPRHLDGSDEVTLHWYGELFGGGLTPDYGGEPLLSALSNFVVALGQKYDGDNRVAFIHLGLLGFWGEWHTYPLAGLVPDYAKERITTAFRESFNVTKLQARYPDSSLDEFGYYDGSFAFSTLDGDANGGVENKIWYFWPMVKQQGQELFWRTNPMGGETRPEIQHEIFEDSYPRRTFQKQDFDESVQVTHATYIMHPNAFINGGYNGTELENAVRGHVTLGYNFVVTKIAVAENYVMSGVVDVIVTVEQIGVAPFYYQLDLVVGCAEMDSPRRLGGLEGLIDQGSNATFTVRDVPATSRCLDAVSISLDSPMLLPGRPMKFSQGDGFLNITIPLPPGHLQTGYDPDQDSGSDETGDVVIHQPSTLSTGETREVELPLPADFENATANEAMSLAFYYLASKAPEQWIQVHNGQSITAPEFGLFVEARPNQMVSSIVFTYGPHMKIERNAPYILPNREYLATSGSKAIIATAYVDGINTYVTTLNFKVVGASGMVPAVATVEKLSLSGPKKVKHETQHVNYTAHGFNTPYAPSLLQLVAMDRSAASDAQPAMDEIEDEDFFQEHFQSITSDPEHHSVSAAHLVSVLHFAIFLLAQAIL